MATASLSHAGQVYYFVTGHTSAQTQIDVNHSTIFFSPIIGDPGGSGGRVSVAELDPAFNWDLGGGKFLLKDGPSTTDTISFGIWEDAISGSPLASFTYTQATFAAFKSTTYGDGDQTFGNDGNTVDFIFGSPITLLTGHHYIAALSSGAADQQSEAYFIKGLADPLSIEDPNGGTLAPPADAPEPATSMLMLGAGSALLAVTRRRKA